jgi:hypothetical protein
LREKSAARGGSLKAEDFLTWYCVISTNGYRLN